MLVVCAIVLFTLAGDSLGCVRVWDLKSLECQHQWELARDKRNELSRSVLSLSYAADGTKLAAVDAAGGLHACLVAVPAGK